MRLFKECILGGYWETFLLSFSSAFGLSPPRPVLGPKQIIVESSAQKLLCVLKLAVECFGVWSVAIGHGIFWEPRREASTMYMSVTWNCRKCCCKTWTAVTSALSSARLKQSESPKAPMGP